MHVAQMTIDKAFVKEIRRVAERRLSPEEFQALLTVPIDAEERARILEKVVRRAYRRWAATQGLASVTR